VAVLLLVRNSMEKRAVKVGRPAWKADRGSNTMGIVLPLLRHSMVDITSESVYIDNIRKGKETEWPKSSKIGG
jgi:hypothetical protein